MKKIQNIITILLILAISACTSPHSKYDYPQTKEDEHDAKMGKITGEDGIVLFGSSKKAKSNSNITVNRYLWQASLDSIYFMPITTIDPFGGTILTDWYDMPGTRKERIRLHIFITSGDLRSDGLRVNAFKQVEKHGVWTDITSSRQFPQEIENKILLRARTLCAGR